MTGRPVVLIAGHEPIRLAAREALEPEFDVQAEAGNAGQAIAEARLTRPEICLIGRNLPGDGLNAVRGILSTTPHTSVVVLGDSRDAEDLIDAIRAGAIGFVPPDVTGIQLRRVVRAAVEREAVIPRSMVHILVSELRTALHQPGRLTSRETQVLGMLRRGQTTAEIAQRLGISPITVRRHIGDLVRRLGARNRAELFSDAELGARRPLT